MRESCYCGRTGEISDRVPVILDNGATALICPGEACGHTDRLQWLREDVRKTVLEEAARKRPAAA